MHSAEPSGVDRFLAGCADLHDQQYRWTQWARICWWLMLLPVALLCWAAAMPPGGLRRLAMGAIAVVSLVALIGLRGEQPTLVSTDEAAPAVLPLADIDNDDEPVASTATSSAQLVAPSSETTVASTTTSTAASTSATTATTAAPTSETTTTTAPTTEAPTTASTAPTATSTAPPTTAAPTTAEPTTTTVATCHPAYVECLQNHPGDALNCGDIASHLKPVHVRNSAVDPYGLDADNDGIGCEGG